MGGLSMVSDGRGDTFARMRCHADMASGFHDYNPKTNNYNKGGRSSSRSAATVPRFGGCNDKYFILI
jgi:hypothetical protein